MPTPYHMLDGAGIKSSIKQCNAMMLDASPCLSISILRQLFLLNSCHAIPSLAIHLFNRDHSHRTVAHAETRAFLSTPAPAQRAAWASATASPSRSASVLISTVALASYLCILTKAGAAQAATLLADADGVPPAAAAGIDALSCTCAICLGEFAGGDALRRGPGCGHCLHACCAERWLRVSATCPVCRDSPVPSPVATPLAEAAALAVPRAYYGSRAAGAAWHSEDGRRACTSRAKSSSID
ncbi:hypothetical protein EJB05_55160, partial [Eragrostis curvula]